MTDDTDTLRTIFRDELADDSLDLGPETALADIPGWDSVNMSCVILGIEKRFGFTFTPAEMDRIETFSDFLDIIRQKTPR